MPDSQQAVSRLDKAGTFRHSEGQPGWAVSNLISFYGRTTTNTGAGAATGGPEAAEDVPCGPVAECLRRARGGF